MLLDTLRTELTTAMKARDTVRVETLRFLLAAVRNEAIAKYGAEGEAAMKDEDVLGVIKKQVKTHNESVEAFDKAGRKDLADAERAQLAILEAYLPAQMSDEDLKKLLEPIVATGEQNFGLLMKQAMAAVGGKADGGRVSGLLRQMTQHPS
jgi:uncharacterized protein YqeY